MRYPRSHGRLCSTMRGLALAVMQPSAFARLRLFGHSLGLVQILRWHFESPDSCWFPIHQCRVRLLWLNLVNPVLARSRLCEARKDSSTLIIPDEMINAQSRFNGSFAASRLTITRYQQNTACGWKLLSDHADLRCNARPEKRGKQRHNLTSHSRNIAPKGTKYKQWPAKVWKRQHNHRLRPRK